MALFSKKPSRLILTAIGLLGLVVLLFLTGGLLAGNMRIAGSALPFLVVSSLYIIRIRKEMKRT
jgi:hypothetical protein